MQKIKVNGGKSAIVDNEDYPLISRFNWYFWKTNGGDGYPTVQFGGKNFGMHLFIMPCKKHFYLRHKNNDTFDNRKENLEMISSNHRRHLGLKKQLGASKYRGVQVGTKKHGSRKWKVVIAKDKKNYFVGYFENEEEAGLAYNKKAKELYGDFAYQNKID